MKIYEMDGEARSFNDWGPTILPPGETTEIHKTSGQGVINRIWCSFKPHDARENNYLGRALVINFYWDGAEVPAVSVPVADFFGQPLHMQKLENHFFKSPSDLCIFNSLIPMPFRKEARVEVVNSSDVEIVFFLGIDIELKPIKESALYFHTFWRRHTDVEANDRIAYLPEIIGQGRYLGAQWAVLQEKVRLDWPWYTRPVQIYLDGEDKPAYDILTLDDFICSGWWGEERLHEPFAFAFTGRPLVKSSKENQLAIMLYRYHVMDPVWFHSRISAVIGPHKDLGRYFKRMAPENSDWSTTVYFYLDRPSNDFPPIQSAEIRTSGF